MRTFAALIIFLASFALPSPAFALEPGENAPELLVQKWIKGSPVKISEGNGNNIFIIEFWATWCPPCRISIPHLSELQKEYADKGVIVAGISTEEEGTVSEFVKKQDNMDYSVGLDNNGKTYAAYMGNEPGIPKCFLVGKNGKLLWKGHPMDIGRVLKAAVSGDFDIDKEKKIGELHMKLQTALQKENAEDVIKISDEILETEPGDELAINTILFMNESRNQPDKSLEFLAVLQKKAPKNAQLYFYRLDLLNQTGADPAAKLEECQKLIQHFPEDPEVLNSLSWMIMDRFRFGSCPLKIALEAAEKAIRLMPENAKPVKKAYFHATLARAYYSVGKIDLAVREQEKAADFAKESPQDSKSALEVLEYYRNALSLGQAGQQEKKAE